MPTFKEVQYYLAGLWLLIRNDPRGFGYMDISDRGVLRSFWAILWCVPPMGIFWMAWERAYLMAMPPESSVGIAFFLRLGLVEIAGWVVPPVLAGFLLLIFKIGDRFAPIVVTINWLGVPFAYLNALLIALLVYIPDASAISTMLWYASMSVSIFALARILRMICGANPLFVAALTLTLLIPPMLLSEFLQRFLGVYPPGA